jgi:hypothetical protein
MTLVMALIACGLCALPVAAASPDPKDLAIPPQDLSKARELIRRLGSEIYREREEAQADLAKMGRLARPALLEAVSADPDPEVRFRCSRLLPKAGADDLKARLDTFLADAEGKFDHNLPGLKQFRTVAGTDKLARELFVEMIKSPYNVELLQMLDKSPVDGGRAISDRRMHMWNLIQQRNLNGRIQAPQQLPLGDIACLIFAETVVPSKDVPKNNMWNWITGVQFVQQGSSITAINTATTPHSEVYKRILGKWLDSRDDVADLSQIAYPLNNFKGFKETLPLILRIINTEGVQGYAKSQAIMHLVNIRGKETYPLLRSMLSNDLLVNTVWFGQNANGQPQMYQCLLRDVALAYLIHQTGQQMTDYGFKFAQGQGQNALMQGYANYAFSSDESRNAAMMKFAFWRMKHADKDPIATPQAPPAPENPVPPPKSK